MAQEPKSTGSSGSTRLGRILFIATISLIAYFLHSTHAFRAVNVVPTVPTIDLLDQDFDLQRVTGEEQDTAVRLNKLWPEIAEIVTRAQQQGPGYQASVVLHDFRTDCGLVINPKREYQLGSLIKIPIMIAILKKIEAEPGFDSALVTYDASKVPPANTWDTPMFHPDPAQYLVDGERYSISQLLYNMIALSGNQSAQLLYTASKREFDEFYRQIGVSQPGMPYPVRSPDVYSRYMDLLFRAKYLRDASSRRALALMTASDFNVGLQAGLPTGVTIAHKFGVTQDAEDVHHWLNECGIIYATSSINGKTVDRPYSLCVFTEGSNLEVLAGLLTDISRSIFEALDDAD